MWLKISNTFLSFTGIIILFFNLHYLEKYWLQTSSIYSFISINLGITLGIVIQNTLNRGKCKESSKYYLKLYSLFIIVFTIVLIIYLVKYPIYNNTLVCIIIWKYFVILNQALYCNYLNKNLILYHNTDNDRIDVQVENESPKIK